MKISKMAFETKWEGYLRAMEHFNLINLYCWRHVPLKRVEIIIKDKP